MSDKNKPSPNPGLQFSSAIGSPETRRKMLLFKQLLQKELVRDNMRPRKVVNVRHRRRQQQQ
ncbi:uncharacterized protein LOC115759280 [Drosophila novamexicana]|uniref:uncharacterized protein LOC115759280 n=1 Tax=Drosophila novamexicana TaxID=47314 RepID=UPI0011E58B5D|nr:uncharacterized protein LOC115759280 [Drosophila novamexicana]